jgi:hypothetical protein
LDTYFLWVGFYGNCFGGVCVSEWFIVKTIKRIGAWRKESGNVMRK